MNDHQREIADAQRAQSFADEVEVTWRVNDVELLARPLRVQQRRRNRNLPVLFADVVIRHRRAVGDAAHAVDDAAAREHGLAEHRLAGRGVTDDGEVTDVCWSVIFHRGISFNLETMEQQSPATHQRSAARLKTNATLRKPAGDGHQWFAYAILYLTCHPAEKKSLALLQNFRRMVQSATRPWPPVFAASSGLVRLAPASQRLWTL